MSTSSRTVAPAHRPWQEILLNWKMLICLFQGFSSGMPLYVLVSLVPAWLREAEVDLSTIGLFALLTLPYNWKFVWAPMLDRFRLPFLGRRRGWILLSQILLLFTIGQFSTIDPATNIAPVMWVVFATAFFSATQDIVLDGYRRELLFDDELGTGNSLFINAYRIASLVPGSLALILADRMEWSIVFWIVAAFMGVGIVTTLLVPETARDDAAPPSVVAAIVNPFVEFFTRDTVKSAFLILAFMVLYKLGDNMAVALQTPFFLDMGYTLTEIGTVQKFAALGGVMTGAFVGGLVMLRVSINRSLWIFGFVQIVTILGYAVLARIGTNLYALFLAVGFENIGVGLGAVALTAFIAKQTSTRFTVTQFALLTSLVALPRTFASASTGFIIEAIGYFNFYLFCFVIAIPGMLMLFVVAPWSQGSEASGQSDAGQARS